MHPHGIHELGENVFVHIPDDQWANTGIVIGDDSVLVVDGRLTPRMGRELIDTVKHMTSKPIRYLVNTHHHGDHTFGNCAFLPGAVVIGHANVRKRMLATPPDAPRNWGSRFGEMAADFDDVVITPPVITYQDSLTLNMGNQTVLLRHHGHGHTDGDTVIYAQESGAAFLGDLLSNGVAPVMGDADSHGWEHALEAVEAAPGLLRLVGGHGPLGDKSALVRQRQFIQAFRVEVGRLRSAGISADQAVAELKAVPGFEDYEYPYRLAGGVKRLYEELERHAEKL